MSSMDADWADRAERTEAIAMRRMLDDLPAGARSELGIATRDVADGVQTLVARDPMGGYWNKALGFCDTVTATTVEDVLRAAAAGAVPALAFALQPRVVPDDWDVIAAAHGLQQGSMMVKFLGPAEPRTDVETDLRITRLDASHALTFGEIMAVGFEVPWTPDVERMFADPAHFGDGWSTYGAWDADRLVGVARMLAVPETETVQLFGAATLPEARGRGAQSALMAARVAEARDRGLRWVSTDTWAEHAAHANPSQHNMVRAGLTEVHRRPNWVWRA